MTLLNSLLNALFDLAMSPFRGVSPWRGLIAASLLTAVVLVGLFKLTSRPQAILRARNRFLARTLELLLFQHDLRVSLTACGRILAANFAYLFQFLLPMLIGLVPLVLIFVQMEAWFARRPLRPDEAAVLTVRLAPEHAVVGTPVELRLPQTARLDSPPVRSPKKNEIAWRVIATEPGDGWVEVQVDKATERKSLMVGSELARVSRHREPGGVQQLLSPSEPPLTASSPIRRMEIAYPPRELAIGLTEVDWIIAAVVLMMAFSLVIGYVFGVRLV